MSLNSNYVLLYNLQQYFVDKTTGLPLSNGTLTFYKDNDRNVLKTVYKYDSINGYTALSNPVPLSGVGTPIDNDGNDIAIYAFPYTDNTASQIELYYVVAKDSGSLTQFTRESIPNIFSNTDTSSTNFINYIPNGQFLLHNDIPATGTTPAGQVTQLITTVAQGGWTYEKSGSATSTDTINWVRFGAYSAVPAGNPRYALRITSTADANQRSLRLKFRDVNKFSGSAQYTFSFDAVSNSGSDLSGVEFNLIKNYGTGGSPSSPDTIQKSTITISQDENIINLSFSFGTTEGKTLGTNNDDYLQLELKLPNASVDITLADFVLTPGVVKLTDFPTTTNAKFLADSLAGWADVPDYDGANLYLPLVSTLSGLAFSDADIGKIFAGLYDNPKIGELPCNGGKYETASYSSDGIPYRRLQALWFDNTSLTPRYGTGPDYITGTYTELASGVSTLRIASNTVGSSTFSAGTSGFSFIPISTGVNTGVKGYLHSGGIIAIATSEGTGTLVDGASSPGFTLSILKNRIGSGPQAYFSFDIDIGMSLPAASSYFKFTNPTGNFYIWFKVDGVGTDPAVGGYTGIQVNLLSTYSINELARIVRQAISGYQIVQFTFPNAAGVTAGTYFSVTTTTPTTYYIWYRKDGIGNDPFPGTSTSQKILVDILTGDTSAIVTTKTLRAINSKYYAVPYGQGIILRGADPTSLIDIDANTNRMSLTDYLPASLVGTTQIDQFFQHNHPGSTVITYDPGTTPNTVSVGGVNASNVTINIASDGGTETRPYNMYVNYFVKY